MTDPGRKKLAKIIIPRIDIPIKQEVFYQRNIPDVSEFLVVKKRLRRKKLIYQGICHVFAMINNIINVRHNPE